MSNLNLPSILIFYHYPCPDGKAAAWVAHTFCDEINTKTPKYFGVDPSRIEETFFKELDDFINHHPDEDIILYSLDISLGLDSYQKLQTYTRIQNFTIIDHHESGYNDMISGFKKAENLPKNYIFDIKESGATLSWKYFHPKHKIIRRTLEYIKDRDIWSWEIPDSKEVCEGLNLLLPVGEVDDFKQWDDFMKEEQKNLTKALTIGQVMRQRTVDALPQKSIDGVVLKDNEGRNVFLLNTTGKISDFGNYICKKKNDDGSWYCDYCLMWRYSHAKKLYYFSLRSNNERQDDLVNVAEIAKNLTPDGSGGGHCCASGGSIEKLPEWMSI